MPVGTAASVGRASTHALAAASAPLATVPRTRFRQPTAAQPTAATISRSAAVIRAAGAATVAALIRRTNKPLTVTVAPSATVARGKVFAIVLQTTQRVGHGLVTQALNATQAVVATLQALKVSPKTLTATQAGTATVRRQPLKLLKTGSMMPLPPLFHSVAGVASLAKTFGPGRVLTASQPQTASVRRSIATRLTAVQAQTAALVKSTVLLARTASAAAAASIVIRRGQGLAAAVVEQATISRGVFATRAATQGTAAVAEKRPQRSFAANANALADLARQKVARIASLTTTLAAAITLRRAVTRELDSDQLAPNAVLTRTVPVEPTATSQPVAAPLQRASARLFAAQQAAQPTLRKVVERIPFVATVSPVATVGRAITRARLLVATVRARARLFTDHPSVFGQLRRTGRIVSAEVGRVAHATVGRIETLLERLR